MLINRDQPTNCPKCGLGIGLTTAMVLQAARLGVSVYCERCQHEWHFHLASDTGGLTAGPKSSTVSHAGRATQQQTW